jgi:hypothetical protein
MWILRITGAVWLLTVFVLWVWGQSNSRVVDDLIRAHQMTRERQLINEEKISSLEKQSKELERALDLNRTVTQQVVNDITFLRGIMIGFGGLMTFLQFMTVVGQYRFGARKQTRDNE